VKIDLTQDQVDAISEWAAHNPHVIEVRLFGSRAKGKARLDSDIDLALRVKGDTPGERDGNLIVHRAEWHAQLRQLLETEPRIDIYDPEIDPFVFKYCAEASVRLYP